MVDFCYNTRLCLRNSTKFVLVCLYTSRTHSVQIWMESQFRYQSYEPLLDDVSACAEHVTIYFAIFSYRGDQMFCQYFSYKL